VAVGVISVAASITVDAQTGLDKYMQAAPQKPAAVMTKKEWFELLRQIYLKNRDATIRDGRRHDEDRAILKNILSNDYNVRCKYDLDVTLNATFTMMNSIVWLQDYEKRMNDSSSEKRERDLGDEKRARDSLASSMKSIKTLCEDPGAEKVKEFLDGFVAESEKWYQAKQEQLDQEAKAKQERAEAEARAEQVEAQAKQERKEAEERDKQERADQARRKRAAEEAQAEQARAQHADALRTGKAEVKNAYDAALFYNADDGQSLMFRPKMQPDGKVYALFGVLDKVDEKGNVLRIKAGTNYAIITKALAAKRGSGFVENLRVGMGFRIIGRYVRNTDYNTVGGETKTAATFEAIYLSLQ